MRVRQSAIILLAITLVGWAGLSDTPELLEPPFDQPVVITSVGQSGGALQARILADRAGLERVYEQRVELDVLEEGKTLIIVLGASGKGLGAAGIDISDEMEWAQDLLDRARELEMAIIAMHIEGEPRRGDMSDRLINIFAVQADYLVINEAGNEDGLFTELSEEHEIPMQSADTTLGLVPILADLFGVEIEE